MTHSVYDYRTGERLAGSPSRGLVRESLAAPSGAVLASPDERGVWIYLREDEAPAADPTVRTVYVLKD